jgi:hypothetical protein
MVNERLIRKDLEGSDRGLIEVQPQNLPGTAEENQDSCSPGQDSNQAPSNTSFSVHKDMGVGDQNNTQFIWRAP